MSFGSFKYKIQQEVCTFHQSYGLCMWEVPEILDLHFGEAIFDFIDKVGIDVSSKGKREGVALR